MCHARIVATMAQPSVDKGTDLLLDFILVGLASVFPDLLIPLQIAPQHRTWQSEAEVVDCIQTFPRVHTLLLCVAF